MRRTRGCAGSRFDHAHRHRWFEHQQLIRAQARRRRPQPRLRANKSPRSSFSPDAGRLERGAARRAAGRRGGGCAGCFNGRGFSKRGAQEHSQTRARLASRRAETSRRGGARRPAPSLLQRAGARARAGRRASCRRSRAAKSGLRALGVDDSLPRGHQVDRARFDQLDRAERIAMEDLALEQIRHCREPDVRMGRDHRTPCRARTRPGPCDRGKTKGPRWRRCAIGSIRATWVLPTGRRRASMISSIAGSCGVLMLASLRERHRLSAHAPSLAALFRVQSPSAAACARRTPGGGRL